MMEDRKVHPQSYYNIGREALYPQEQLLDVNTSNQRFSIGIPKEHNDNETRIPLTPQGVGLLIENGHDIFIESGAGESSNFTDTDFSEVGAVITETRNEVFIRDIIVKVTLPTEEEIGMMKERGILFSTLNLLGLDIKILNKIIEKKLTSIALDLLTDDNGIYPVVRSLSEIEGNVSVNMASHYLSTCNGGKGVLLGGVTGISPAEVVILGAGTAGTFAAKTALGMGATVKAFDYSISKLHELEHNLGQRIFTSNLHPNVLAKSLKSADVVVGTLRFLYGSRRFMVTEELIRLMKPGSVIVDLSVDQGGCFETSKCTTIANPVHTTFKVKHVCLPGLSVLVPRTASIALSNILSPILLVMGEKGSITEHMKSDNGFCNGVYCYQGILTNHMIGQKYNIPSKELGLLLAAF